MPLEESIQRTLVDTSSMLINTKAIYRRMMFSPGILGILFNHLYFARCGLFNGIKKYSKHMHGKLLDFGCGNMPYKALFHTDEYVGVDIARRADEKAGKVVFYDGTVIPFADEYFDCIFSSQVFEHIFNLDEVLGELNRVLKSGGSLLVTVPFAFQEHEMPWDYARYTSRGICYLLKQHGFEVIELEKSTNYVEAVFQSWIAYLGNLVTSNNAYLELAYRLVVVMPFTITGILCSHLLPKRFELYHSNVILGKKLLSSGVTRASDCIASAHS